MRAPPTTYHVHAHGESDGDAVIQAAELTLPVAARSDVDEPSGLPGPAELLFATFAACLMKNVERSSALTGFASDSADIDVTARR